MGRIKKKVTEKEEAPAAEKSAPEKSGAVDAVAQLRAALADSGPNRVVFSDADRLIVEAILKLSELI